MTRMAVQYGTRRIEFDLDRRDVQSLSFTVTPDGTVKVIAPLKADESRVLTRVQKRGSWIVRQCERMARLLPEPPAGSVIRTGESVRYLGRQYRLRIHIDHHIKQTQVQFSRSVIELTASRKLSDAEAASLIGAWLRQRASLVLTTRFRHCAKLAELYQITGGSLSLRSMTRRWGSCSRNGRIIINPDLVRAPVNCIDYVILHELCHLKVHAHSPAFYRLLGKVLPDWQLRRKRLARVS
jgi:predicted metal-dependent hydrolase